MSRTDIVHDYDVITCHVISPQLTVQCHRKKTAPCKMRRGSATTDGRFAYFTQDGSNSVYQYECGTEKWKELPSCPYRNSGLVIIDRKLTAVGGSFRTTELYTLRQRKWVEKYPPMNTVHFTTAVVSTSDGEYLIVIGGWGGARWTATVELFQVKSRRWYKLTDLPQPLDSPSATICGDIVHVVGDGGDGYSYSLAALPSSDKPIPPQSISHLISWKPLPPLPVKKSTAATLWTASSHWWWQARWVTSQLHSPASGWTVGGDWLYDWWQELLFSSQSIT